MVKNFEYEPLKINEDWRIQDRSNIFKDKPTRYEKIINKLINFLKPSWHIFAFALIIMIAGMLIIDLIAPLPPSNFRFTWNGILMFMGICAGIGWVIHGTGFLIVRVK